MTDKEFTTYLNKEYEGEVEQTIRKTIDFLRVLENEHEGDGYAALEDLKSKVNIKEELYEAIKLTLDFPDKPYKFTDDED